jgi:hypothetical protein
MPEVSVNIPSNDTTDLGAKKRQRFSELYEIGTKAKDGDMELLRIYAEREAWSLDENLRNKEQAEAVSKLINEMMTLDAELKSSSAAGPKGRKPAAKAKPKVAEVSETTSLMDI